MRRSVAGLLLLAAAAVAVAAVAVAPSATSKPRLAGPRTAVAAAPWTAVVTGVTARPVVLARRAGTARRATVAAAGSRRWRVRLRFPNAGRWTLSARVGSDTFPLGAVLVRPGTRPLRFSQPGGIAVASDGSLVLAVQGENRVVRVDPATGGVRVLAETPRPWGIAVAADGTIVFSSASDVVRREPDGRTETIARFPVDVGPVAFGPGGDLFVGAADHRVYRIRGTSVERFAGTGDDMSSPHGFAFPGDGSLLVSDTGYDRILRVDAATRAITTHADGVRVPNGIALAPDGSLYVTESQARRVTRIGQDGRRESVGPFEVPTQVALGPEGVLYVVEWEPGQIRRVERGGRITTVGRRVG